jgi:hypothetical protein
MGHRMEGTPLYEGVNECRDGLITPLIISTALVGRGGRRRNAKRKTERDEH